MLRSIKEFIDKFMFLILPVMIAIAYNKYFRDLLRISYQEGYNSNLLTITSTLIGTLFTVFSIFISLPSTKFIEMMKKYGQYRKMNNILLSGLMFSFIALTLSLTDALCLVKEYMFVLAISQTIYAAINLYRIATYNSKSKES